MFTRKRQIGASLAAATLAASMVAAGASPALAAPSYKVHLVSLECMKSEDGFQGDEAYLRVNGVHVWGPQSMKNNNSVHLNIEQNFASTAQIRLYDADTNLPLDPDDFLGEVTATAKDLNKGEQRQYFKEDGAKYKITYKVISG